MAENQDLRNAVLAEPDVDEPRLAYAAWCDTQPDEATRARGAFIRHQLEHAQPSTSPVERYVLRDRADALLALHRLAWAGPLASLVDDFEFHRGFIALITLSASDFLERAQQLFTLAPIQHLNLSAVSDVFPALFTSVHLQPIRSLSLDRCGLGNQEIQALAASPHLAQLQWLSLGKNNIDLDGADALAASPHLKQLTYIRFFGNLVDPGERYAHDQGIIVDTWLPEEGQILEDRHGYLPWLHLDAESITEVIPDRFRRNT